MPWLSIISSFMFMTMTFGLLIRRSCDDDVGNWQIVPAILFLIIGFVVTIITSLVLITKGASQATQIWGYIISGCFTISGIILFRLWISELFHSRKLTDDDSKSSPVYKKPELKKHATIIHLNGDNDSPDAA